MAHHYSLFISGRELGPQDIVETLLTMNFFVAVQYFLASNFQYLHATSRVRGQVYDGYARPRWRILFRLNESSKQQDFFTVAGPSCTRASPPPPTSVTHRRIRQRCGRACLQIQPNVFLYILTASMDMVIGRRGIRRGVESFPGQRNFGNRQPRNQGTTV